MIEKTFTKELRIGSTTRYDLKNSPVQLNYSCGLSGRHMVITRMFKDESLAERSITTDSNERILMVLLEMKHRATPFWKKLFRCIGKFWLRLAA